MYLSYLTSLYNKGRKKKSEIINELLNFSYVWAIFWQKVHELIFIDKALWKFSDIRVFFFPFFFSRITLDLL